MSGIPPNILQMLLMAQQQRGMRPGQPGNMGGVLPQGPQPMPAPGMMPPGATPMPAPMQPGMGGGMPGGMPGGMGPPMGGPGVGPGVGPNPAHAAYHAMRMQNPNMPAWATLSPQQQSMYGGMGGGGMPGGMGQPGGGTMPMPMGPGGGGQGGGMPGGMGAVPPPSARPMPIKSFKKGGVVEKTGVYRLHKGEKVIPAGKTAPARERPSDKKTTVRHASAKSEPVKHASARHAPPPKKRK